MTQSLNRNHTERLAEALQGMVNTNNLDARNDRMALPLSESSLAEFMFQFLKDEGIPVNATRSLTDSEWDSLKKSDEVLCASQELADMIGCVIGDSVWIVKRPTGASHGMAVVEYAENHSFATRSMLATS